MKVFVFFRVLLFVDEADAFLRKRSKVCSDILSVFNQSWLNLHFICNGHGG
jgi:hypothetical protein